MWFRDGFLSFTAHYELSVGAYKDLQSFYTALMSLLVLTVCSQVRITQKKRKTLQKQTHRAWNQSHTKYRCSGNVYKSPPNGTCGALDSATSYHTFQSHQTGSHKHTKSTHADVRGYLYTTSFYLPSSLFRPHLLRTKGTMANPHM